MVAILKRFRVSFVLDCHTRAKANSLYIAQYLGSQSASTDIPTACATGQGLFLLVLGRTSSSTETSSRTLAPVTTRQQIVSTPARKHKPGCTWNSDQLWGWLPGAYQPFSVLALEPLRFGTWAEALEPGQAAVDRQVEGEQRPC